MTLEESLGCEKFVFNVFDDRSAPKILAIVKWVAGPSNVNEGTSISIRNKKYLFYIIYFRIIINVFLPISESLFKVSITMLALSRPLRPL